MMKIKILEKKDQPLLYRQEYKIEVEFDNEIPKRRFLREQVAKASKAKEDLIIIEEISPRVGEKTADVLAYIYNDEKKMDSFVPKYLKKRHEPSEAEKKAAEEAAKKAEAEKAAQAEEKKEETEKPEEKKEGD